VTLLFKKQDKHREIGLKITKRVVEKLHVQEKRKEEKLEERTDETKSPSV
jgi:hypothetical protein